MYDFRIVKSADDDGYFLADKANGNVILFYGSDVSQCSQVAALIARVHNTAVNEAFSQINRARDTVKVKPQTTLNIPVSGLEKRANA